jgi:hypothetical protein
MSQRRRQFSSQSEDEIKAFRHFLQKADINVVPDSIVKRNPPEPDILCRLIDGSGLAFELVELVNRKNVAGSKAASPLASLVERAYQELPRDFKNRFDVKFCNRALSFAFRTDVTRNQITPKLPRILRELATQSSLTDDLWKFSAPVMRVLSQVSLRGRVDTPGRPSFNIAMWLDNTDVVTELVLSKTLKSYTAFDPIELLAYFSDQSFISRSQDWKGPLRKALLSNGLGPFRRIWVMGETEIEFSHSKE